METTEFQIVLEISEVDQLCDVCDHEITVGEEYYYDQATDEVICQNCIEEH